MEEKRQQIRVAFYLRVSTEEQSEKHGWDLQRESLDALVKSKGRLEDGRDAMILASEDYVYKDDISGTTELEERPEFARLKEDILLSPQGERPFDMVAVYKIDRFARKLKILLEAFNFVEAQGMSIISAHESIDTSTPFGRAILGIVGVIAELELETIKQRTQGGKLEAIKKGIRVGAGSVFGYKKNKEKNLEIYDDEAKIVRLIFRQFIHEKRNTQQIADYLRSHEYLTPEASAIINKQKKGELTMKYGNHFWRASAVRSILMDDTYIGDYYYNKSKDGKKLPRSEWKLSPHKDPAIIDVFSFRSAQMMLSQIKSVSNSSKSKDEHSYLLSGLIKCHACSVDGTIESNLISWNGTRKKLQNKNDVSYYYTCGRKNIKKFPDTCKTLPIPAKALEQYVLRFTKKLLSNPVSVYEYQQHLKSTKLLIKHQQSKKDDLIKLLNGLQPRKDRLSEQHEMNVITSLKLKEKLHELSKKEINFKMELNKVEEYLAKNTLSEGYLETLKLFSDKYRKRLNNLEKNKEEVSDILHILIDKIIVYSRPVTSKDKIAGPKKENQLVPYRLEIKLKLPQEIVKNLINEFLFKTDTL